MIRHILDRLARPNEQQVKRPRMIVIGDSHVAAMEHALDFAAEDVPIHAVELYRLSKKKANGAVGNVSFDNFLKIAEDLDSGDFVFSAIAGNQYAILSTVQHPIDFDFVEGGNDVIAPDVQQIPQRMIDALFDRALATALHEPLKRLRDASAATVIQIAPPPPKADNQHIAKRYESKFAELGIERMGPSRPELRLRSWRAQQRAVQRICDELGIAMLDPPPSAVTADGFLDPGYYGKDATHANRRYGRDVLLQILEWVDRRSASKKKHSAG